MHQEIKDRIIHLLEEIVGRAHSINQQPHGNEGLEIDLVMEDIRSLYRQFDLLRRQPEPLRAREEAPMPPTVEQFPEKEMEEALPEEMEEASAPEAMEEAEQSPYEEAKEEMPAEPESPRAEMEDIVSSEEEVHPGTAEEKKPEASPARKIEPHPVKMTAPEPAAKPAKESPHQDPKQKVSSPRSVLDLFSIQNPSPNVGESLAREDNTLHKRIIAQKEDRSIGTRLQMIPISSLKEAIGVNEKFLFINELFGGNIQVYNETIARLNEFRDMQEAFDYLNELNDLLGWDENRSAQTIEKLAGFVQRRYMER